MDIMSDDILLSMMRIFRNDIFKVMRMHHACVPNGRRLRHEKGRAETLRLFSLCDRASHPIVYSAVAQTPFYRRQGIVVSVTGDPGDPGQR